MGTRERLIEKMLIDQAYTTNEKTENSHPVVLTEINETGVHIKAILQIVSNYRINQLRQEIKPGKITYKVVFYESLPKDMMEKIRKMSTFSIKGLYGDWILKAKKCVLVTDHEIQIQNEIEGDMKMLEILSGFEEREKERRYRIERQKELDKEKRKGVPLGFTFLQDLEKYPNPNSRIHISWEEDA